MPMMNKKKLYITNNKTISIPIELFKISYKKKRYFIQIKNIGGTTKNNIEKGSTWYFSDGNQLLTPIIPTENILLAPNKNIDFTSNYCKNIYRNNFIADLKYSFNSLQQKYTWRNLKFDTKRHIWLQTCLDFNRNI